MAAQATNLAALAAFHVISGMNRISPTVLGLLTTDQISKMCKRLESPTVNPIVITTVQEQLLLDLHFWVANSQQLQLPIIAEDFTMITALNQVQRMHHHAEDDARMDKEIMVKARDKFKSGTAWKVFAEATETGEYDETEWQNLSLDQHTQVLEARGTKWNVNTVTINNGQRNDNHISTIADVPASVATGPANAAVNIPLGGSTGTQFGHRRLVALSSGTQYKRTSQSQSRYKQY
jgi:hypothetical protein